MPVHGFPLRIPNRSLTSILIIEPTLGIDAGQPPSDLPPGATPYSRNFVMRDGALEPRPTLNFFSNTPTPLTEDYTIPATGVWEFYDTSGVRYPVVSGTTHIAWYSNKSFSALSYLGRNVSGLIADDIPSGSTLSLWDATQIYEPLVDENIAVFANGSYQTLYCWEMNTDTVFSSLTGAPRAKYVTSFDNYLVAWNIRDIGSVESTYPQRVQWSDRGSASSWTGGLAGFEDLLTMRGEGTRAIAQDNRIVLFSTDEIWQGYPSAFPFVFRFEPLDRSVGCPYPWTVASTPLGIVFLSRNMQVYLLPKDGGPAIPVGQKIQRILRTDIEAPDRAFAVYDPELGNYQLHYARSGDGGNRHAIYLDLFSGSWAPQEFDPAGLALALTRATPLTGLTESSTASTWDGMTGFTWDGAGNFTWNSLGTVVSGADTRAILFGSDQGTLYYSDSAGTSDHGAGSAGNVRVWTPCTWRSSGLWGEHPATQKTLTEIRIDYQTASNSSVTLHVSANQGQTLTDERTVVLPSSSVESQVAAYPYLASRFPMFQIESDGQRYRIFRFLATARIGGR